MMRVVREREDKMDARVFSRVFRWGIKRLSDCWEDDAEDVITSSTHGRSPDARSSGAPVRIDRKLLVHLS